MCLMRCAAGTAVCLVLSREVAPTDGVIFVPLSSSLQPPEQQRVYLSLALLLLVLVRVA